MAKERWLVELTTRLNMLCYVTCISNTIPNKPSQFLPAFGSFKRYILVLMISTGKLSNLFELPDNWLALPTCDRHKIENAFLLYSSTG
uniref:Uncharacterized protein n=1 Tax=Pararge aegeria TaxID=116150 RepID=S4NWY2_9NEOP